MADVWSFNTTIRNPERMEALLRILTEMGGDIFDENGQKRFFGLQIKKRFYTPLRRTLGEELTSAVYESDQSEDLEDEVVARILNRYQGEVDCAARGRTSVAVLNRFGLSIALQSHGPVVITPLGKKWLSGDIDDEELFTRFLLRWQYPNPIETGYNDFNIKPFVGVLHLLQGVNEKWKSLGNDPKGLSKEEYSLFALSLKSKNDIQSAVDQIIVFREKSHALSGKNRTDFINDFAQHRAITIFGNNNEDRIRKQIGNLKDYADSSLRYFRITGIISLRGADRYVDIATDKLAIAKSIINSVPLSAINFPAEDDYLNYLGDLSYNLPWQNDSGLHKISENLSNVLATEVKETNITFDFNTIENEPITKRIEILQDKLNEVRIQKLRALRYNLDVLDEAIARLSNITSSRYETVTARPSLDLEWFVSRAMMVLNDALRIEPSFKVGDDGLPTGFRGNASDIECEYESFGLTLEVTLLSRRDQWVAEGQPVMRHLRDFEDKLVDKDAFCFFIAPIIHRDTLNQFWTSNKYEYEGKRQNIIPVTIIEFVEFLKKVRKIIESKKFKDTEIRELLKELASSIDKYTDSLQWQGKIKELLADW